MNSNEVQPYRMRATLKVLGTVNKENPITGVNRTVETELFTLHYAPVKRTLNQQYSLLGTKLDNTISVRIRSNSKVTEVNKIKINDVIYSIVQIDRGVAQRYIRYDFLTLRRTDGKS